MFIFLLYLCFSSVFINVSPTINYCICTQRVHNILNLYEKKKKKQTSRLRGDGHVLVLAFLCNKEDASNVNSEIRDSLSASLTASGSMPPRRSMAAERGCVNLRYYAERGA